MKIINALSILAVLVLGGCSSTASTPRHEAGHGHHGHVQEKTASVSELPKFLDIDAIPNSIKKEVKPLIINIYRDVPAHKELLEHMPCYCGCGAEGHQSSFECFVHEVGTDGSVTWDSHGITCGTCLLIARDAMKLQKEGKTPLEIRNIIDEQYKEGYAEPTATPMPMS